MKEQETIKEKDVENSKTKAKDIATKVQFNSSNNSNNDNNLTDKLDAVLTHRIFGILFFGLIMWLIFTISQIWVGPLIRDVIETGMGYFAGWVEASLTSLGASSILIAFILEGIIGGFTAIIGFLPLIMVLFFFLHLLEDSGYMTRVALLMDKYFKKIGLAGKSIIPMYVGTACSIPAIMSARTIKNKRQKRMTILLTPFIPCGAKLPVIALFLSVFFAGRAYITALVYLLAIFIIFLTGMMLKKLLNANFDDVEDTFFIIELPEYKLPSVIQAFLVMLSRAKAFVIKAGTIIMIANAMVWLLVNFDFSLTMVDTNNSILAFISGPFAWLLTPIGVASWGLAAAAVLGFIAKEEVVSALAIIFAFSVTEDFGVESLEATRQALSVGAGLTSISALSYMAFNLFTPPCFAAIGAMNAEFDNKKWTVFAVALQLSVGYLTALIIYQVGTLVFTGSVGMSFIPAMIVLAVFAVLYIYLVKLASKGKGLAAID